MAQHDLNDRTVQTAANLARGWQRLLGPALVVNVLLFVYVLFTPLLATRIYFLYRHEIVLAWMATDLYGIDTMLFLVVFAFGIVAPAVKLLSVVFIWYFVSIDDAIWYSRWTILIGRLSMLDILLLAVAIVAIKGTGIGSIEIKPGLYVYVFLVVGSYFISLLSEHVFQRTTLSVMKF